MVIEIKEIEADRKKSAIRISINGKTFYKAGLKTNIEENISDYADYISYCLLTINQEGITENERPFLLTPFEFEEKKTRLTNEEQLKEMFGNIGNN